MYIYIIIVFIIFVYGAFSTIFHSTDMVGNIGKIFGDTNLNLFGYLAYIDLLILLYPLYRLYKNENLFKRIEFFVGWMLFFISLVILQSLLLEFNQSGSVGTTLKLFLLPYIGKAGMWLLLMMTFMVSFVLLYDEIPELRLAYSKVKEGQDYILSSIKNILSRIDNPFFDKRSTEVMTTIVSSQGRRREQEFQSQIIKPKRAKKIIHKKKQKIKKAEIEKREESLLENIAVEDEQIEIEVPTSKRGIVDELEENRELLKQMERGKMAKPKNFTLPKIEFLEKAPKTSKKINEAEIDRKIGELLDKLAQFKIQEMCIEHTQDL